MVLSSKEQLEKINKIIKTLNNFINLFFKISCIIDFNEVSCAIKFSVNLPHLSFKFLIKYNAFLKL